MLSRDTGSQTKAGQESITTSMLDSDRRQQTGLEEGIALSHGQRRIWFIEQLFPGRPALIIKSAWHLEGDLDINVLSESLEAMTIRHQIMRTRYPDKYRPIGEIVDGTAQLEVVDSSDSNSESVEAILNAFLEKKFDLTNSPPVRFLLIRQSAEKYIFAFCAHHIAFDGFSLDVFHNELSRTYNLIKQGDFSLTPLEYQYSDYAREQIAKDDDWQDDLEYWRKQLAGAESFSFHSDFPRQATATGSFGVATSWLEKETLNELQGLARSEKVTPFMVLLSALFTLGFRHTGRRDLTIGVPISERSRPSLQPLIGMLLNNLPLRVQLQPSTSFRSLIQLVRKTTLDGFRHHEVPYEKIVETVRTERQGSAAPLFNVMLNMLGGMGKQALQVPGVSAWSYPLNYSGANFDMTLYTRMQRESMRFDFVYDADLYTSEHMDQLASQFRELVASAVERPDASVESVKLDRAATRPLSPTDRPPQQRMEELVKSLVDSQPNAIALLSDSGPTTYKELWRAAESVAIRLRKAGSKSGDVVAVVAQRAPHLVSQMLGILVADASMLILDASDPEERVRQLMVESGARFVLATSSTFDINRFNDVAKPLSRSDSAGTDALGLASLPLERSNPYAYVSFTSGTTARPKKVLGTHATLVSPIAWRRNTFQFNSEDRFAFLSSLTSDACFRDTLLPLAFGASIVVPDQDMFLSPGFLATWLAQHRCTVTNLTSALAPIIVDSADLRPNTTLRLAFFVGDVLKRETVEKVRRWAPRVRIINYYGTTETGQSLSWHDVDLDPGHGLHVPIGVGENRTAIWVRSSNGERAAPFERGEIVFSSNYLAALPGTAENPTSYDTGDIGYQDGDGLVHYVGRDDRQVKIRGYRVSLPEIDQVLREGAVEDALSVVSGVAEERIIAHLYAPNSDDSTDVVRDLTRKIQQRLPSYMAPQGYVVHPSPWPTNRNGKPDLHKLGDESRWTVSVGRSKPDQSTKDRRTELTTDDRALLKQICGAFEDVLGVPASPEDDFFSLGGHSLLAVELFGRLSTELQLELPLAVLFAHPTPLELLQHTKKTTPPETGVLVKMRGEGRLPPLYVIHGAGGNVLKFDKLTRALPAGRPIYGLQARGVDGISDPHSSITEMASEYFKSISETYPVGPIHLAGYSGGGIVALELARLAHSNNRLGSTILLDTYCPYYDERPGYSRSLRRRGHIQELKKKGPGYLITWAKSRINFEKYRIKRIRYNRLKDRDGPIPHDLREVRLINAFSSAVVGHRMTPVDFPVVLIASEEERVSHSEWYRWMRSAFTIHSVSGRHDDFILEPSVKDVARLIDETLHATETRNLSPSIIGARNRNRTR